MHIVIFTLENDNVEHITTTEDNEVESREKRGEGSAWPLCSGLPLSAAGCRVVEDREENVECSAWLARVGAPRTAESPCDPLRRKDHECTRMGHECHFSRSGVTAFPFFVYFVYFVVMTVLSF